jgi:hypothetical protein
MPFADILEIVEEAFSLDHGVGMAIFKKLVRTRQVSFDMEAQFNPVDPRVPLEQRGVRYGRYASYS